MRLFLFLFFFSLFLGCSSAPTTLLWEPTGGPHAQNLSTLLVDESNPSQLFAGLITGSVYVSTNQGAGWHPLSIVHTGARIHEFIQHPDDPQRIYAATEAGLFVSTNRGSDWSPIPIVSGMSPVPCLSLAIEPFKTQTMYAGCSGLGIFKTTDGGATWASFNAGIDPALLSKTHVHDIRIDPTNPERILAALSGIGVVSSLNGGKTWTRLTETLATTDVAPTQILIHPRTPIKILLGMSGGTLYSSPDGGSTWSPTRLGTGGNHPVSLGLHPANPDMVFAATESEVLVSSDFGTTWRTLSDRLPHLSTSITVSSDKNNPALYVYGQGLGVQRSIDEGKTWTTASNGLGGATVTGVTGTRNGDRLFAVAGTGVSSLAAGATGWVATSDGLTGGEITSLAVDTDSMAFAYASTISGLFFTKDKGASWFSASPLMHGRRVFHLEAHPIIGTRMFLANDDGLFVSTDRGQSWKPTRPSDGRYSVNTITFSPMNAGLMFAATSNQAVIRSSDGGFKWETARFGIAGNDVIGVTLDVTDQHLLYAWTRSGQGFRSTNQGIVWDRYSPPWNPGERTTIAIDKYRPSSAIALVAEGRVYYTANGGATWFQIPAEPPGGEVRSLYWNAKTRTVYAGMEDLGVYRLAIAGYLKEKFRE